MSLLKGTFFLKIVALILAVITYVYIHNEMNRAVESVSDPSYKLIKLTAKSLPLKVHVVASPPEGYKLSEDVKSSPESIVVIGPEALLEEAHIAETALLDLSENTKTVKRKVPIVSVAGIPLRGEPYLVEVTVPIEKIEKTEPAA